MKPKTGALMVSLFLAAATACGYMAISKRDDAIDKGDPETAGKNSSYNSAVIIGSADPGRNVPVMVMACDASRDDGRMVEHVFLRRPGRFMIYVPEGKYHVYAFADSNENGFFTGDEIFGASTAPGGVDVAMGEAASAELRAPRTKPAFSSPVSIRDDGSIPHQMANGDIIKLYDEAFCMKNAGAGLWKPTLFMKAFGATIFLTETYDPKKIPVLLVHGAEGSPQNWAYFHFRLNSALYQPWYYYYPSGIRLSLSARLLYESLLDLKKKFGFTRICITAHSMGGLITRYLLCYYDLKQQGIDVRLFVTLASPWSGFESADWALRLPTKKLPSWIDVASHSAFIRRALSGHLPPTVSHHLFYGKSDSVAAGRALDERVFTEARGKHGFDVTHDTILADRNVFMKYSEILSREMGR